MSGYGVVYEVDTHGGKSKKTVTLIPCGIGRMRDVPCGYPRSSEEMPSVDRLMHAVYRADVMYRESTIGVMCRRCGTRVKAYYCEDRLYAVRCDGCESVTLVRAQSPIDAMLVVGEKWWEGKKE